jgi:putative transposase
VDRQFTRSGPDQLWVTDSTEDPTREGKADCAVVLEGFSRRVVGCSSDTAQTATLVTGALGLAIANRSPTATGIHYDPQVQCIS